MNGEAIECVLRSALVEEIPGRAEQIARLQRQRKELDAMIQQLEERQERAKLMLRAFDIYTGREQQEKIPY